MEKVTFCISMLCASVFSLATISCSSDDDGGNNDNPYVICPVDETSRAVFDGSRDMTYPFFAEVNKGVKPDENFMISPLSLTEVLTMLANGADGNTRRQILDVMNIKAISSGQASEAMKNLNSFLTTADKKSQVAIANSQWIDSSMKLAEEYVKNNENNLGAETFHQDLSTIKIMNNINSWCERKTYGCIKNILSQPLSEDTKLVLINALYFKGLWNKKFNSAKTTDEDFTNYDGTKSKVKMMHQTEEFYACVDDKFDMAEFPYGNKTYCMDVILPHEGVNLDECLKDLNNAKMEECFNAMGTCEVTLGMPRMELKYRRRLNADLQTLGMKDAFNPTKADFTEMSADPLFVSYIEQVTSLKVDEEGTEAAAVTYAGMDLAAAPPSGTLNFIMNRPFAFLIRERQTGVVLFIGRMVKF